MDALLKQLTDVTGVVSAFAWGLPSIILLVGVGFYLTVRLNFLQIRLFPQAIKLLFTKNKDLKSKQGETTPLQALCAALSATVGTGNIAGVATAIVLGGAGALFWMWITALVGMATKFASCILAVKYREIDSNGEVAGGPMYTLKNALNMPRLGAVYAIFAMIASYGIGNGVQANSIVRGLEYIFPAANHHNLSIGLVLAFLVGLVIIGGIKRIGHVAVVIVPFMAIIYILAAATVLILHAAEIPKAFYTIFNLALNPHAAGGAAIGVAMQYGVARGVFSNEAGLGSAAIAHASAKSVNPMTQGVIAMLGPFIDTIILCTMTGLVIVIMTLPHGGLPNDLTGAPLSAYAFDVGLAPLAASKLGGWIVGGGLVFFAYTTMITWSYYGDRCAKYLFGDKGVLPYRIIFILMIVVGATIPLQLIWNLADITNILMAIPNLICLVLLAKTL